MITSANLTGLILELVQIALALIVHNLGRGNQNDSVQSVVGRRGDALLNLALASHQRTVELHDITIVNGGGGGASAHVLHRLKHGANVSAHQLVRANNTICHSFLTSYVNCWIRYHTG